MFAHILDKFSPAAAFAVKLFAAAKLDFHALFAAGDENALKAHLEKGAGQADVASAVEAATKQLQSDLSGAQGQVSTLTARAAALETGAAAVGITLKASDEKAGLTAADVEKSIRARASIMACEQLAKHGLPAALNLSPAADPAAGGEQKKESNLVGRARYRADFERQLAGMRASKAAV